MTKASNTRHTILEKAFDLIYKKGYQATSIDEIIATTKVTKGAFYYHFKTKDDMGVAIINEIVKPNMHDAFITPLQDSSNPVQDIYLMTKSLLLETPFLKLEYGCPASNLSQEMTPWNSQFSEALSVLVLEWQITVENSIKRGIEKGNIINSANPKQVALFVISGYWGIRNFGKVSNSTDCYHLYLEELKLYLKNLSQ
ncbi:TetR/AcrR family transcriptional regulator [Zobellia barbeyronii]|uniref:TetR/AcrR family transcriptional regulator n=1 Tax=Zobellia barbeyronii TaxID=2748009 RepID=A0ABS5WA77_9FLAO|nr:TetR/AcrR family transcriptional regulator [Zobellia barbeyronii]MBT2159730.1 TetR/AcrR family transcriptional regulator [Zobellia barbeyronii]